MVSCNHGTSWNALPADMGAHLNMCAEMHGIFIFTAARISCLITSNYKAKLSCVLKPILHTLQHEGQAEGDSGTIYRMSDKCTTKSAEGTLYSKQNVNDGWLSEAWFLSYNLLLMK
jgi:hypothetical protein